MLQSVLPFFHTEAKMYPNYTHLIRGTPWLSDMLVFVQICVSSAVDWMSAYDPADSRTIPASKFFQCYCGQY